MLDDVDRLILQESIFEAQVAAERYLSKQSNTQLKILELTVEQCLVLMEELKEELQKDEDKDRYKLHLLVPTQILEIVKTEENNER